MTRLQKVTALCCAAGILATMLLFIGTVSSPSPTFAGKGGGGGGGKPPKDPPPPSTGVQYRIDVIVPPVGFPLSAVRAINNLGMVVGTGLDAVAGFSGSFLYDHTNDVFYDLNSLTPLTDQLDTQFGEVGWSFVSASAINDGGDFIGSLASPDYPVPGALIRAYAIRTTLSVDPQDWTVVVLPDHGSNRVVGSDINLVGDVLVHYERGDRTGDLYLFNPWLDPPMPEITLGLPMASWAVLNNNGQIAGEIDSNNQFVFDSDSGTFQWFAIPAGYVAGLNDDGVFAGGTGPNGLSVYRHTTQPTPQLETIYTAGRNESVFAESRTQGINANWDVLFVTSSGTIRGKNKGTAYLVHTGFAETDPDQILKLNDLIASDDPIRDYWIANRQIIKGMSDRTNIDDATGYPQLAGMIMERLQDGSVIFTGVVLTPFIPEP